MAGDAARVRDVRPGEPQGARRTATGRPVPAGAVPLIRAVVFDLFHTLVDPEEHRPRSYDRIAEAARLLSLDPAVLQRHWGGVVAEAATTPQRPSVLLARACREMPSEAVLDAVDDAVGRYQDLALAEPLPGVTGTLRVLRGRGLRLGLLSNAHERDVRSWHESPLGGWFDAAVFSCFAGVMKPDPAAYRVVLDELGVAAADAVFVGDGNSGEFSGARRSGFCLVVAVTGAALRSGLRTPDEMVAIVSEADVVIGEVAVLPAVLRP